MLRLETRHPRVALGELRALIPAAELALVDAADLEAVRRRAEEHALTHRCSPTGVTLRLPKQQDLDEVASYFRGTQLHSIRLEPVGLEEIFAEIVGNAQ